MGGSWRRRLEPERKSGILEGRKGHGEEGGKVAGMLVTVSLEMEAMPNIGRIRLSVTFEFQWRLLRVL